MLDTLNRTKKKIILKAIEIYNDVGVFNALNQDIAKASEISLSNFNYHFPKKENLVFAVCGYMQHVLNERITKNQLLSHDAIILELTKIYLQFENEFRFFYMDTHNIITTYTPLKEGMESRILEDIQMIKNLNYIAIGKGYMKPEPEAFRGLYEQLANQIWISSHFWYAQSHIRKQTNDIISDGLKQCFASVYPYLTPLGIEKYTLYLKEFNLDL